MFEWRYQIYFCFAHDSFHSIPQSAEIEAKEIGVQGKKIVIIVLRLDLQTVIIHIYNELQKPAARQSYSGHIFVTVTFKV